MKKQYAATDDTKHTVTGYYENQTIGECFNQSTYTEAHQFLNGKCQNCRREEVLGTLGEYITTGNVKVRMLPTGFSMAVKMLKKGTKVKISRVVLNSRGNYWGMLEDGSGFVWMKQFDGNWRARICKAAQEEYDKYKKTLPFTGTEYATGAWCAKFVLWCAERAGIPSTIVPRVADSYTYQGIGLTNVNTVVALKRE